MDYMDRIETLIDLIVHTTTVQDIEKALVNIQHIDEKDSNSHTPLYYAATRNESVEVVKILIKAHATLDFYYLEQAVIHNKNQHVAIELYNHLKPLTKRQLDYLFLLVAAHRTDYSLLTFFKEEGANINSTIGIDLYPDWEDELELQDDEKDLYLVKQNAIVLAFYENPSPITMIRHLIHLKVNVNFVDSVGNSILTHALDDLEVLQVLIQEGAADIHITDSIGKTPLMSACEGENNEVALYLIEKDDELNRYSNEQKTALHYALSCHLCNNFVVVRALIAKGADIKLVDGNGNSALDIAINHFSYGDIIRYLEQKVVENS